jgi:PhzF family phenazine biosynthesis protein
VGYSETAFVEAQGSRGQYRVRYFSPQAEVAFCGHATITAAVAIADRDGPGFLQFSTLAGPIPVQTSSLVAADREGPDAFYPPDAPPTAKPSTTLIWEGPLMRCTR